jgi:hypothetical protein
MFSCSTRRPGGSSGLRRTRKLLSGSNRGFNDFDRIVPGSDRGSVAEAPGLHPTQINDTAPLRQGNVGVGHQLYRSLAEVHSNQLSDGERNARRDRARPGSEYSKNNPCHVSKTRPTDSPRSSNPSTNVAAEALPLRCWTGTTAVLTYCPESPSGWAMAPNVQRYRRGAPRTPCSPKRTQRAKSVPVCRAR